MNKVFNCYLTEKQLAELLQIPVRSLQNQRQSGKGMPYLKIGRLVRYNKQDIEKYLESQKRLYTSQDTVLGGTYNGN